MVNFTSTAGGGTRGSCDLWALEEAPGEQQERAGGWRLSQVSLRTELDSLLQVTPSGKFCFHH